MGIRLSAIDNWRIFVAKQTARSLNINFEHCQRSLTCMLVNVRILTLALCPGGPRAARPHAGRGCCPRPRPWRRWAPGSWRRWSPGTSTRMTFLTLSTGFWAKERKSDSNRQIPVKCEDFYCLVIKYHMYFLLFNVEKINVEYNLFLKINFQESIYDIFL